MVCVCRGGDGKLADTTEVLGPLVRREAPGKKSSSDAGPDQLDVIQLHDMFLLPRDQKNITRVLRPVSSQTPQP